MGRVSICTNVNHWLVQDPEKLALIVIAWTSYRQLAPDRLDDLDQPITSCYLSDLDAHLNDQALGNGGIVGQRMVFSLLGVFNPFKDRFEGLNSFLATVLDRETPFSHN
jgi:hypothetical protein